MDRPLDRLVEWIERARAAGVPWPEACCLATAGADGRPSARMVLFKNVDRGRLTFATNYGSDKASDLDANPRAALVFFWPTLDLQVRVAGSVERLEPGGSDAIHFARPRASQVSAWASRQSRPIASHEALLEQRTEIERRFEGVEALPRPPFWGGYALTPEQVEFWEGRRDRFHHRERFVRDGDAWTATLLQP